MLKNKILNFKSIILVMALLALLTGFNILFMYYGTSELSAATSADAIAIRVVQNSNCLSAASWYVKQKFVGSPQSLLVDGYEAVRDGRTVYLNATNIKNNDAYPNIYIISYNQNAENATVDIFGQIISHWKFNINSNLAGSGICDKTATKSCFNDVDCPTGEHCSSLKAKVVRDTKRKADLAKIYLALACYKSSKGYYPKLTSGSYLPGKSLSVWPSWQQTLAKDLGQTMPIDPINKLGQCPEDASCKNYDKITCWDQNCKKFKGTIPNGLPSGSSVYAYSTNTDGTSYELIANQESSYEFKCEQITNCE